MDAKLALPRSRNFRRATLAAALVAVAGLVGGVAAVLERPAHAGYAAGAERAAPIAIATRGSTAVDQAGAVDPSVPAAAAVFEHAPASVEEAPATF